MKFTTAASLLAAAFTGLTHAQILDTIYPSLVVQIESPGPGSMVTSYVYVDRVSPLPSCPSPRTLLTHTQTPFNTPYERTSLLAYSIPSGYSGKDCSFEWTGAWSVSGTHRLQVYSLDGTITEFDNEDSRPARDVLQGKFTVSTDVATVTWDAAGGAPTWACPGSATTLGFEVMMDGDGGSAVWGLPGGLALVVLD